MVNIIKIFKIFKFINKLYEYIEEYIDNTSKKNHFKKCLYFLI